MSMKDKIKNIPLFRDAYAFLRGLKKQIKGQESVFTDIYNKNLWGDKESVSGGGSNLAATEYVRKSLPDIIRRYGIRTMIDAPCGDLFWMQHLDLGVEQYTGVDIVQELIEKNQKQFPDKKFLSLDLSRDTLPLADLIFCRDCLVHLPFEEGVRVLKNIRRAGIKFLLTTTYAGLTEQDDIFVGQWRKINLTLDPYGLSEPLELLQDNSLHDEEVNQTDKKLGLWEVESMFKTL